MLALLAGTFAFLAGLTLLAALPGIEGSDRRRLFEINAILGTSIVFLGFGSFAVYQAASAIGGASSRPMPGRVPWLLLPLFPVLVVFGQWQVHNPGATPWLFPLVNLGIVAIPSLLLATLAGRYYQRTNALAWPVSWREWSGAFMFGAVGAVFFAGVANSLYVYFGGAFVLHLDGQRDIWDVSRGIARLPREWGIAFDLSVISVVAPLNEEFVKGLIVALFAYRKGGAARCFTWGVLAGTGFSLIETFLNSVSLVDPVYVFRGDPAEWSIFAVARGGTAAMHGASTGLAALAFYGLMNRQWLYLLGYPAGVLLHANWNAAVYLLGGDQFFSWQGPDTMLLDITGISYMVLLGLLSWALVIFVPRRLHDSHPAAIYVVLGMAPGPMRSERVRPQRGHPPNPPSLTHGTFPSPLIPGGREKGLRGSSTPRLALDHAP